MVLYYTQWYTYKLQRGKTREKDKERDITKEREKKNRAAEVIKWKDYCIGLSSNDTTEVKGKHKETMYRELTAMLL
jgi:hypothetical protein